MRRSAPIYSRTWAAAEEAARDKAPDRARVKDRPLRRAKAKAAETILSAAQPACRLPSPTGPWSKAPPGPVRSKRPPPRKQTIEVDLSWLEDESVPPPRRSARPARPSGPPERKKTIEVQLDWLEADPDPHREPVRKKRVLPPPLPREEPVAPVRAHRKLPPPLPREEPVHAPRRSRPPRGKR